jgi:hypothetical protein
MIVENKVIWMIWLQGLDEAPDLVKSCVRSWKKHNVTWQVKLIAQDEIPEYLCEEDYPKSLINIELSMAHKTDILRILLLKKYGGVWADCTVYCTQPLNNWLIEEDGSSFFAFRNPGPDRMISNWFMCSNKDGYIINHLVHEVSMYWKQGKRSRFKFYSIDRVLNKFPQIWFTKLLSIYLKKMPYFWFHYLFAKIYKFDNRFKQEWDTCLKMSAIDPHSAQIYGLCKALNNIDDFFNDSRKRVPMYKLSWKYEKKSLIKNSMVQLFIEEKV